MRPSLFSFVVYLLLNSWAAISAEEIAAENVATSALSSFPQADFPQLQWLHPVSDRLQHLTSSPAECLNMTGTPEELYLIEVGRQAFRSPALLGGQAARAGLSCQGCHINGHSHPEFYIEGVSGVAGTVDVSTAVFSEVRGDNIHNPIVIPSLLNVRQKQSFGTATPDKSLSNFVRNLIVEEFAGEEPSSLVLSALVSYLNALSSSACPIVGVRAANLNDLEQQLFDILRSIDALEQSYQKQQVELAQFLILSLQHEMSNLYQRFAIATTQEQALKIIGMSRELNKARLLSEASDVSSALSALRNWTHYWQELSLELKANEANSLYQRQLFASWLLEHP